MYKSILIIFILFSSASPTLATSVKEICSNSKVLDFKYDAYFDRVSYLIELSKKYNLEDKYDDNYFTSLKEEYTNSIACLSEEGKRKLKKEEVLYTATSPENINRLFNKFRMPLRGFKVKTIKECRIKESVMKMRISINNFFKDINKKIEMKSTNYSVKSKEGNKFSNFFLKLKKINPLFQKLEDLEIKYRTEQKRVENSSRYIQDILDILKLSKAGKGVLSCWNDTKEGPFWGDIIKLDKSLYGNPSAQIKVSKLKYQTFEKKYQDADYKETYPSYFDKKHAQYINEKVFVREAILSAKLDPLSSLLALGHELKHLCDKKRLMLNAKGMLSDKKRNKYQRLTLVDEMKAYDVSLEIFKELALFFPNKMCNSAIKTKMFEKYHIIPRGDYYRSLEEIFEDPVYSWANFLVDRYPFISRSAVYTNENDKSPIFKSEVEDLLQDIYSERSRE
jgi:hypothetical protein